VTDPVDRLAALAQAAATVMEETDLTIVLKKAVSMAATTTGARYAALGILGDLGGLVEFVNEGIDAATVEAIGELPQGHGLLGTVIRQARTIRVDHISEHPDSVGFPPHHPAMDSFLGVPVRVGGTVFGNLYLTEKPGGFSDDDAHLIEAVAALAGSAVSNSRLQSRLRQLALVDERERIARDVHDSVIQNLFAIGLTLQGLALRVGSGFDDSLNDLVDRIDGAIDELRRLIFGLRQQPIADVEHALERMLDELGRPPEVELDVGPGIGSIDAERIADLIAMVREATANALRHSGAGRITVHLETVDRHLIATVTDNGAGFVLDPDDGSGSGMGLGNMRARALRLNGHVAITSERGRGSVIEIVIPA
jgi:signal transduction histidine kinase